MGYHLSWLVNLLGLDLRRLRDPGNLVDRLRLQKAAFLLKHLGVKPFTSYDSNLYLRGPYSPVLADEYYGLGEGGGVEAGDGVVEALKWFMAHDGRWLEVASSIILIRESYPRMRAKEVHSILLLWSLCRLWRRSRPPTHNRVQPSTTPGSNLPAM